MPGKLDEISEAIGDLRASVRNLHDQLTGVLMRMSDREAIQDRRHRENRQAIEEAARENRIAVEDAKQAVLDIMNVLAPLNKTVEAMSPIIAAYQIARWKKAGALGVAFALLSALGWLLEAAVIKLIGSVLSRH